MPMQTDNISFNELQDNYKKSDNDRSYFHQKCVGLFGLSNKFIHFGCDNLRFIQKNLAMAFSGV